MAAVKLRNEEGRPGAPGLCLHCNAWMPKGPDICLGYLPGVSHACCGHGNESEAYVVIGGTPDELYLNIEDAVTLRGSAASTFFALVKNGERKQP